MEKGKDSLDGMGMANGVLQRERLACMLGDWHASSFDEKGYPTFFFLLSCCIDGRGDGLRTETFLLGKRGFALGGLLWIGALPIEVKAG